MRGFDMSYLKELYGTRGGQFIYGYLAAMETFAIWHDGEQYVGVMQTPLKEAMQHAVSELSEDYYRDSQLVDKFF